VNHQVVVDPTVQQDFSVQRNVNQQVWVDPAVQQNVFMNRQTNFQTTGPTLPPIVAPPIMPIQPVDPIVANPGFGFNTGWSSGSSFQGSFPVGSPSASGSIPGNFGNLPNDQINY
jgi:hypothetical protein